MFGGDWEACRKAKGFRGGRDLAESTDFERFGERRDISFVCFLLPSRSSPQVEVQPFTILIYD